MLFQIRSNSHTYTRKKGNSKILLVYLQDPTKKAYRQTSYNIVLDNDLTFLVIPLFLSSLSNFCLVSSLYFSTSASVIALEVGFQEMTI